MKIDPPAPRNLSATVPVEFECPWCPHRWSGTVRLNIHNYNRSAIGPVTHLALATTNTRVINEHECVGPGRP